MCIHISIEYLVVLMWKLYLHNVGSLIIVNFDSLLVHNLHRM